MTPLMPQLIKAKAQVTNDVTEDIVSGSTKLTYAEVELKSTEKQKKKKENKGKTSESSDTVYYKLTLVTHQGSYVHLKWLAVQKDLDPQQQPRELQRLTDVRKDMERLSDILASYPSAEPQRSSASSWSFRQQKASDRWKEARPDHLKCLIAKEAVGHPLCWLCHEPAVIRCTECLPEEWFCGSVMYYVTKNSHCTTGNVSFMDFLKPFHQPRMPLKRKMDIASMSKGQLNMKRKGEISDFFIKKHKQADQVQTDPTLCTGSHSSSIPETSQSQCGQTSGPPADVSRDDTETSGSEQDSEPELTEDVIEPLPVASSTRFAVPKGPSDISRSREEGPVQPCLTTFPRTQHGTRKRAFNSSWYKDNSWLEYSCN
ncbi:zinc finger MYM-type 1-like protein [Labeo rohita]|uniref:Zinc finger MYM-type 1-like protein n=1 Tax=Labeo rohita TaxID=84645 RepID=A0A498LEN0_LABRO|nr:zinc finger MYM-type 1-like protein [Labeo rohita]